MTKPTQHMSMMLLADKANTMLLYHVSVDSAMHNTLLANSYNPSCHGQKNPKKETIIHR